MDQNLKNFLKELDAQNTWSTEKIKFMLRNSGIPVGKPVDDLREVRVGDVFGAPSMGGHPAVVIKIDGDQALAALLSSKNGPYAAHQITNSRFFTGSYVSITLVLCPVEGVRKKYLGSLDDLKEVKASVKAIKLKIKEVFRKPKKIRLSDEIPARFVEDFQEIP